MAYKKREHIYRVYESIEGVLNCEEYPVIYKNKWVVYYKEERGMYLRNVNVLDVSENFETFFKEEEGYWGNGYRHTFDRMFWELEEESELKKLYERLIKRRRLLKAKRKYEEARMAHKEAEKEYQLAFAEYERLSPLIERAENIREQ